MPDCLLEYSDNVHEEFDNQTLFGSLHLALASSGLFRLEEIYSRALVQPRFLVGAGQEDGAFIHLRVNCDAPLQPRDREALAGQLMDLLQAQFNYSVQQLHCRICVEIVDTATLSRFRHPPPER